MSVLLEFGQLLGRLCKLGHLASPPGREQLRAGCGPRGSTFARFRFKKQFKKAVEQGSKSGEDMMCPETP